MAKTRSQTGNITIKKEEKEEDCTSTLGLGSVTKTTRNTIAKRTAPKNRNRHLPAQDIKVEEDTDIKSLLQSSSKNSNLPKRQFISQEQIDQLIDAIVNENMSVLKASCKVKVSPATAYEYYNIYKNGPDKKIPSPLNCYIHPQRSYTQAHIENLITYIKKDKMSIPKASAKANMSYKSGREYYLRYLKDPSHIPVPNLGRHVTDHQKNEFIGYVINDKMSIAAAARKAKFCVNTGSHYYHKYFEDQNLDVPTPSRISTSKRCTQEQIKEVISYIVGDKMSIAAASRKANMCQVTAGNHYRKYLKSHNMEIPAAKLKKSYTQEQINILVGYIIDDNMTIAAASRKVNMCQVTASYHYHQYIKNHNMEIPVSKKGKRYKQDEIDEFISYIVDDKMTIKAAAKKANISYHAGTKYYRRYLNDIKRDSST